MPGWRPAGELRTAPGPRWRPGPAPPRPRPVRPPPPSRPSKVRRERASRAEAAASESGVWLEPAAPGRRRGRRIRSPVNGHHCVPRHLGSPGCQDPAPALAARCPSQAGPSISGQGPSGSPAHPPPFTVPRRSPFVPLLRGRAPRDCPKLPLALGSVNRGWGSGRESTWLDRGMLNPGPRTRSPDPGAGLTICARASPSTCRRTRRLRRAAAGAMAGGGLEEDGCRLRARTDR